MTWLVAKRAFVIAPDASGISTLSTRLKACGLQVVGTTEGLPLSTEESFDLQLDIIVVKVRRGQEMDGYRVGSAAAARNVPVLFVAIGAEALAIDSLMHAVPGSVLVEYTCTDDIFRDKVIETLAATCDGKTSRI